MRDSWKIIVVGLVSGLCGAVMTGAWGSGANTPRESVDRDQLQRLESQVRRIEVEQLVVRSRPAPGRGLPADAGAGQVPSREETLDESRIIIAQRLSDAKAAWEDQERDTSWAPQMEASLSAAVAHASTAARVVSVDCHRTLCQMVVEHHGQHAQRTFMQDVVMQEAFRGEGMMQHENDNGQVRTRFIIGREGESFL